MQILWEDLEASEIMSLFDPGLKHLHKRKDDWECGAGPRSGRQCPGAFTFFKCGV